jgi:hypothetical protein
MVEKEKLPIRIPKLFSQTELKNLKFNMIKRGMPERQANSEIEKLIETNYKNHLQAIRKSKAEKQRQLSKGARFVQPKTSKPV